MKKSISINDFRQKIGWSCTNYPYSVSGLRLINNISVAEIGGAKIFGVHFSIYYKYDAGLEQMYYPLVFMHGGASLIVKNEKELDEWIGNECALCYLCDKAELKKEILKGKTEKEIRQDEISHEDRLVYHEIYDWDSDDMLGYKYVEIKY